MANVLAFKPQISERLPDRERERRQLVPTLTWVMAPKWSSHEPAARPGAAKKTVSLNQADLNGNREEEANSCFSQ